MKIHKIAALVTASVLMTLYLGTVMNADVTGSVFAEFAPTATPRSRIPVAATPIRILFPFILSNAPSTINCITLNAGLTPVGTHCTDPTIGLNFTTANSINGSATTVARGDHTHFGQQWIGGAPVGFSVETTATNGYALTGYSSASSSSGVGVFGYSFSDTGNGVYGRQGAGSGITPPIPAAVWGDSKNNWGMLGTSDNYVGVVGISNSSDGVRGATNSTSAFGVSGTAPITGVIGVATNAGGSGVYGRSNSTNGNGVYGYSGDWNGVRGSSDSGSGVSASSNSGTGLYATSTSGFAINVDGDAKQTRNKGGMVKAMALITVSGGSPPVPSVSRCFNDQTSGSSVNTAPCGFTVSRSSAGVYIMDFGFQVSDRFVAITPAWYNGAMIGNLDIFPYPNQATLDFFYTNGSVADPLYFMVFVY